MTPPRTTVMATLVMATAMVAAGCYWMRGSSGGGEADFEPPRKVDAADVAIPAGYRIEAVATGLTFPTGVAFDGNGTPYVVESGYSYGEVWTEPRLLRIRRGRAPEKVAAGGRNGPWNGVAFAEGIFYVAEGGQLEGGKILRIRADGRSDALVEKLPSVGDHHTNGPIVGPDGAIYFGQGVATNSGGVGADNADFGWLKRKKNFHDVPCRDIKLTGRNFESDNVLSDKGGTVSTGAYVPFGTPTRKGQVIKGQVPCGGAIMRIAPSGGDVELVAWGFRNPFGLAFAPDGRLYVADNGYDDRGSRPVWGNADLLWAVTQGAWYGWPDYSGDRPLSDEEFQPPGKDRVAPLILDPPGRPPRPVATFGVHSSSNGFDFSRSAAFGHVGDALVAQFGDQAPVTGKVLAPVGFKVVRVNVRTGAIEDFAVNRGDDNGPASRLGKAGLERPVAARFDPSGTSLYVVDFGVMLMSAKGPQPQQRTGVLWRIWREGAP
jgi:glucose/arabinose dehydrogenase